MSLAPLDLVWSLPEAWFLIPLDGDLDEAVHAALTERAARDPRAAAAQPELEELLRGQAESEREAGAVIALVRWGIGPLGEMVAAYVGMDRFERDDGPIDPEIEQTTQELLLERPGDRAAPLVEQVEAHLGPGVKRQAVQEVPPVGGTVGGGMEVAQLSLLVELFVWVEGRRDLLRFSLTSFQVGHAATLVEELEHIAGSLELGSG